MTQNLNYPDPNLYFMNKNIHPSLSLSLSLQKKKSSHQNRRTRSRDKYLRTIHTPHRKNPLSPPPPQCSGRQPFNPLPSTTISIQLPSLFVSQKKKNIDPPPFLPNKSIPGFIQPHIPNPDIDSLQSIHICLPNAVYNTGTDTHTFSYFPPRWVDSATRIFFFPPWQRYLNHPIHPSIHPSIYPFQYEVQYITVQYDLQRYAFSSLQFISFHLILGIYDMKYYPYVQVCTVRTQYVHNPNSSSWFADLRLKFGVLFCSW